LVVITGIVVLLATLAVALAPERYRSTLQFLGVIALMVGFGGFGFLAFGPKDYLVRWPALSNLLHPYRLSLFSLIAVLFSVSTWIGLLAGRVVQGGTKKS
jgi:hypothetical protein